MEYYSTIKRNGVVQFAETSMGLEYRVKQSEGEKQILYNIAYMWNLEKERNILTDIENKFIVTKGKEGIGGEINQEFGINIYTLLI